ncbi:hypothetical protein TNIN_354461, partial [Trichonephila inaurata madagascariensis]
SYQGYLDRADSNSSLPLVQNGNDLDMANIPTDMELEQAFTTEELFTNSIAPALYMRAVKVQQGPTGKNGDDLQMSTDMRRLTKTNARPLP